MIYKNNRGAKRRGSLHIWLPRLLKTRLRPNCLERMRRMRRLRRMMIIYTQRITNTPGCFTSQ